MLLFLVYDIHTDLIVQLCMFKKEVRIGRCSITTMPYSQKAMTTKPCYRDRVELNEYS